MITKFQNGQRVQYRAELDESGGDTHLARVEIVENSMKEAMQGFVRGREPIDKLIRMGKTSEAVEVSRAAGLIYANEIRPKLNRADFIVRDIIRAATTTDGNAGSLAGDLILQGAVEYLQNFLPLSTQVTSDFRNEPILFNQTALARYLGDPTLLTYSPTTGWGADATVASGSTPSATDIPVKIDTYKGVEIRFASTVIAGTMRNLFREQVIPSVYKLASTVNDALLALITAANFPQKFTIALGDFKLGSFATVRKALDDAKVARTPKNRTFLMHSDYGNKLLEDSNWILASAFRSAISAKEDVISTGMMPEIFGIQPIDTQTMPTTGNLGGFAFGRSALALAARIPTDYTTIFPDLPPTASVTVATEPMSGISMMMVRYLNHQLESANARVALMYGVAKGQANAGTRLVTA